MNQKMTKKIKRKVISDNKKIKVYVKFDNHCAYCGVILTVNNRSIDHKQPISKGGTNNIKNLYPACTDCNTLKSSLSIEKFRRKIKETLKAFPVRIILKYYNINITNKVLFYYEIYDKINTSIKIIHSKSKLYRRL